MQSNGLAHRYGIEFNVDVEILRGPRWISDTVLILRGHFYFYRFSLNLP